MKSIISREQNQLSEIKAQVTYRAAFRAVLQDGKRRYIAPGITMRVTYPSATSVRVLLHTKRRKLAHASILSVRKRLEANGFTLEAEYQADSFWEGVFV